MMCLIIRSVDQGETFAARTTVVLTRNADFTLLPRVIKSLETQADSFASDLGFDDGEAYEIGVVQSRDEGSARLSEEIEWLDGTYTYRQ